MPPKLNISARSKLPDQDDPSTKSEKTLTKKKDPKLNIAVSEKKEAKSKDNIKLKGKTQILLKGTYSDPKDVKPKKVLSVQKMNEDNRKIKDKRTVDMYQQLTQHEQIYKRPETFIGPVEREERVEEIFDTEEEKFIAVKISTPFAMVHLLMEAVTNAADNADNTRRADPSEFPEDMVKKLKNIGKLQTWFDKKRVKITNNGLPMPVIPSDDLSGNLIPIVMFGELNSSSNYDDDEYIRTGAGRNGVGIKLANIFSVYFRVRIGDPINGQEFDAIWVGNMTELAYLKCTPGYEVTENDKSYAKDSDGNYIPNKGKKYTGTPYVEVEYELDFERFGYTEYDEEAFGIFMQRVLFLGMAAKIVVSINDKDYDVRNIRNFAKLRFGEEICKSAIIHYEWPTIGRGKKKHSAIPERFEKMTPAQMEKAITNPESPDEIPVVELLALDTPYEAVVLSSVNGQCTPEDGVHVTASLKAVTIGVLEEINNTISSIKSKKNKKGKGKGKGKGEDKEIKLPQLTVESVKKHISLIVSCRLFDTAYSTQTKVKLTKPTPKIIIGQKTLDKVKKWQLVEKLYEEMEQKIDKALKKTDGKKKRFITPDKGEDANLAGGENALECILYWTEGDSANAYPKQRIASSPGGKDLAGYMPGKGKSLNICKATPQQMIENVEINRLKEYTGIFEGIDVTSATDKAKMRYGFICISTDADKDGQHILMLRINYIWRRFPSLIEEGMVGYLETPFARALKGTGKSEKCLQIFRNQTELEDWLEENDWFIPDKKGYWIKYYKGLASSRPHDIIADVDDAPMIVVLYDDLTQKSLDIAFHPDNADRRKEWIAKWRNSTGIRDIEMLPVSGVENWFTRNITSLCNRNLVEYSKETYIRALPSENDGLKESQRKALYGALKKWSFGRGTARSVKTGGIANSTAELTHYHYNVNCLIDTYTRQAQEFTGANNMSYFTPEGMLGTRHEGGADAGEARYTEIDIAPWIRYVYHEEFLKVIKRNVSDGNEVEPEWLPGVIPMHMVNGFKGIATAYSTFGANHNPYDLIRWLKDRCSGNSFPQPVKPWYIDFTGKIELSNIDWSIEDKTIVKKSTDNKGGVKINIINSEGVKASKSGKVLDKDDSDTDTDSNNSDTDSEEDDSDNDSEEDDVDKKAFKNLRRKNKLEEKAIRKANKSAKGRPSMRTYGVFKQKGTTITITDLPIGIWTYNYRKSLEKLRSEGIITGMRDLSQPNGVHLTITGFQGEASYKKLKLVRSEGMSNMVLIDKQGFPTRYKNTQEIMEKYYECMIEMFIDLKTLKLKEIKDAIFDADQRILFITKHNCGELIIEDRPDEEVYAKMDEFGIEHKYYDIIKARDFSQRKIEELQELIKKLQGEYKKLFKTTVEEMWIDLLDKLEAALKKNKICLTSKISEDDRTVVNVEDEEKVDDGKKKKVVIKKTSINNTLPVKGESPTKIVVGNEKKDESKKTTPTKIKIITDNKDNKENDDIKNTPTKIKIITKDKESNNIKIVKKTTPPKKKPIIAVKNTNIIE